MIIKQNVNQQNQIKQNKTLLI